LQQLEKAGLVKKKKDRAERRDVEALESAIDNLSMVLTEVRKKR
ncbi:MAG: hypothetical protein CEN91_496, partial [Candidatus Berkelbacteria bacterium Licking1014_85]